MTYRELFFKANRLFDAGKITLGEYAEMTKPLDREIECLDKIIAEIDQYLFQNEFGSEYRKDVLQIIDKHRAESEE